MIDMISTTVALVDEMVVVATTTTTTMMNVKTPVLQKKMRL
jgi:hypothetical protein